MTYLATENISLAEMTQPTKKTVKLLIPDGVTASIQEVTITVDIMKKDADTTVNHSTKKETDNTKN